MSHISILILTLNEETNIGACLDSCAWCDDIVVFDSFSADKTVDIARARGVRIFQRQFDNYAAQRSAALRDVDYRRPWVLMLDADERIPESLALEMSAAVQRAGQQTTMFRMRRKDWFFGRWLRRSSGYPTWFGRLVRPNLVRVERAVNEEYVTDGKIGHLQGHLDHHPFHKGVAWWYERHNRYSTLESLATIDDRSQRIDWHDLISIDAVKRRRQLKRLAYRLPGRPLIVFFYLYIVRLGILDGIPGLYFSAMRASYELMIDVKVRELTYSRNATDAVTTPAASPAIHSQSTDVISRQKQT